MDARRHIALVDDDPAWLDTLAEYLEDRGFHVHTAQGARSGLALLDEFEAAAVVIDYHMPEMDGLQLLRHLRQRRKNLDVLLLSGEDDPGLASRALAEGAVAFLCKSTAPALLLRRLVHALCLATQRRGHHGDLLRLLLPALRETGPWLPVPWLNDRWSFN